MNRTQELKEKLLKLFAAADVTRDGDVTAVDESNYTCTVTLPNGLVLDDVQLKALRGVTDCVVLIPKIGSSIQIVNVGNPDYMMLSCDEVDKVIIKAAVKVQIDCENVVINGGDNKGLVKLDELKSNLDSLKAYCEGLKSAVAAGLAAVGSGALANGTTGQTTFNTNMAGQSISFGNMENTKVKH